jgi:2-polyprenyl-6-methoxyphenol hydroxylase-like FAD-dependent oxidoreductase
MTATDTLENSEPVAIVGAGPVGLALALALARHGVRSVVVERRTAPSEHSKAPGIHVRTREIFRQWGIEHRFLETGVLTERLTLHSAQGGRDPLASLDFSELHDEADRPGLLIVEQAETERLLLEAVRETGVGEVRFSTEAVGLEQNEDRVRLRLSGAAGDQTLEAAYVVGCDGAGSFIREALGLPFDGITYSVRPILADVRIRDGRDALPWPRVHNSRGGLTVGIRLRAGLWRLIRLERGTSEQGEEVPEAEVRDRMLEVLGEGAFELVWASRFRIHRRAAPRFRIGRVLLAGDAAHVHSPVGGLGMNGGIQDAHNLAWKLAHALRGGDADRLLDSYEVERRAVIVETVSRYTDLVTRIFLQAPAALRAGAFALLRLAMRSRRARRANLRRMTMLDLTYPASPLLDAADRAAGVRLPNPLLRSPDGGEVRLYDLLPDAPVLIAIGPAPEVRFELPLRTVIRIGAGAYTEPAGLLRQLLGSTHGWMLVRPDAHIAWARQRIEGMDAAVRRALGN